MHRDGYHWQVEIVKHDRNMVVQTSLGVEVKTQCTAADHGDGWNISQPRKEGSLQGLVKAWVVTAYNMLQVADWEMAWAEYLLLPGKIHSFKRIYITDEYLILYFYLV